MINTLINASSRYPVDRQRIRNLVQKVLGDHSLEKETEVSIYFAGDRKVKELNLKYRKINDTTDVLSFPLKNIRFPDNILRLGDVLISFPQARKQAIENNIIIDEEIDKLLKHGLLSLLGLEE